MPWVRLGRAAALALGALGALGAVAACGDDGGGDLLDRLAALDGVTVQEVTPSDPEPGLRYFDLWFTQPIDHDDDPSGATFQQYAALIHRDVDAPVVLYTSGYGATRLRRRHEVTGVLGANQLSVEHRFFDRSIPDPGVYDWAQLTVEEAAADFHAVTAALRGIYGEPWVHTGGSKGGVTALFQRYLYPEDADATVAYVAPVMTGQPDLRFDRVLDAIGPADCRDRLRIAHRAIAERQPAMAARAAGRGDPYELLGVDVATEIAIIELEWSFWQYRGVASCAEIPAAEAGDDALWAFLERISPPAAYSDPDLVDVYQPFVYQVMRELGYPVFSFDHIADLVTLDYQDLSIYLPDGIPAPRFDPSLSTALIEWAATDAEQVLLVYGEWDPWSGGAIDVAADRDALRIDVAQASHWSANLAFMSEAQRAAALAALARWTGVEPSARRAIATSDHGDSAPRREPPSATRPWPASASRQ
jgi:hypothetical protein